ncbi:helix-turn-helix domain-containing protein [Mycobacterium terramassiliense]|uniref:DNA binding, excisionase family domain protein n=1 Tax=Mycobacterium terramassiliense TaxID=1841859 RepID=A0A2U3N708_9MYCO|nr:helix-turn-helix domain-containing protein [Mycobacterium terramassiliense]SPM27184.1 DNA binding, excisionase family domain protein [Mycobacterium terramassiliense]
MNSQRLDLAAMIERHVLPDGSVVVPHRAAQWLERKAGVTQERRLMLRDTDPELYAVLGALHLASVGGDLLASRSANGPKNAERQHNAKDSDWLTTAEAANLTGVTDRCIRKWIAAERLPAKRHGRSWMVDRQHLNIAQALAA